VVDFENIEPEVALFARRRGIDCDLLPNPVSDSISVSFFALSGEAQMNQEIPLRFVLLLFIAQTVATILPTRDSQAAPLYEVYTAVTILPGIGVSQSASGPSTVERSLSRSGSNAPRFGQARAKAGPGGLLAFMYVQGQGVVPSTFVGSGVSGQATAELKVDDFEIGSPLPEETQIATNLNLRLRGVIGFDDTTLAGIIYDEQRANIYLTIDLPGPLTDGSGQTRIGGSFQLRRIDGVETIQRSGVLADLFGVDVTDELGNFERRIRIDANITTPDFYVPVNTPVTVGMGIEVFNSQGSREGFGVLSSDFEHTLTFAPDRPVFNLPAGYTANSAAAGIVDNQYVIPEPSSAMLCATALLAVAGYRRIHR
jgi:hypothetical protein